MSSSPFSGVFEDRLPRPPKPDFSSLPDTLRRDLCVLAGASCVTAAQTAAGGFSVSAAWILSFDSGARFFVKGSHPGDLSHGAANLRAECDAYRLLPVLREIAPEFIGMAVGDAQDEDGWWLGAWQALDAAPPPVFDARDLFALLDHAQRSDVPAGAVLPVASAHPYLSQFFTDRHKWRRLAQDDGRAKKFDALFADAKASAQWRAESMPRLLALQARVESMPFRLGLMHGDLRLDNFLFGGEAWRMIDWANAAEGPLLFDRVMLAASLLAAGRLPRDAAAALALLPGDRHEEAAPCLAASMAGYFADQMYRPVPDRMPGLRRLQQAMFWGLAGLVSAWTGLAECPAFSASDV